MHNAGYIHTQLDELAVATYRTYTNENAPPDAVTHAGVRLPDAFFCEQGGHTTSRLYHGWCCASVPTSSRCQQKRCRTKTCYLYTPYYYYSILLLLIPHRHGYTHARLGPLVLCTTYSKTVNLNAEEIKQMTSKRG